MKFLILMLTTAISFSSFADVTIIKSKINGTAVATNEKVINIMNPTMEIDGKEYSLFGSEHESVHTTGKYACKQLNMKFVNLTSKGIYSSEADVVEVKKNEAMVFNDGKWSIITTLTCKL